MILSFIFVRVAQLEEACGALGATTILAAKEGFAVPASAALALDHDHNTHEPDSQASPAPSAPVSPTTTPKKRGRPRITPQKDLSPLGKWIVEDRNNDIRSVARDLSVSVDYVYLLINGDREPSPDLARKIFKVSNGKLDANALYLYSSK